MKKIDTSRVFERWQKIFQKRQTYTLLSLNARLFSERNESFMSALLKIIKNYLIKFFTIPY